MSHNFYTAEDQSQRIFSRILLNIAPAFNFLPCYVKIFFNFLGITYFGEKLTRSEIADKRLN